MALAVTAGVLHLPFGERPQYGSPYPEGIAVASATEADDASGGSHTFTFVADGGFLYRLELLNYTRGEATARVTSMITSHSWAARALDIPNTSFDINWFMLPVLGGGFSVYLPGSGTAGGQGAVDPMAMIRRFPSGRLDNVALQQLLHIDMTVNTNTITNDISVVWTYWRKESLYQPGFLASFYESPAVPPLIRSPI